VKLARQLRRVVGTASIAAEMAGRLAFLRALEDAPDLRSRATVLQQVAKLLLDLHSVQVEEQGDPPAGVALIVSNHVSYLDPLVILARFAALPVAKDEVRRWPVIGTLCQSSGVQFVARSHSTSGASVLRVMARTMKSGASILNFPEGTTSAGGSVLPLKPACFAAARIARVPVVPVSIRWESPELSWTGDASFLPHYLGVAGRDRIRVRLRWGPALLPSAWTTNLDLSEQAHRFLTRSLQETPDAAAERA
jgi:1-acyl-sn-glycerol-3-phosphate acyltransferase